MSLADRLAAEIAQTGPLTVAQFMAACLYDPDDGYYTRHAAIGAGGDFTTAPEVSQVFGELVGLFCAQSWADMGAPDPVQWIELGPGRGTLMADAARAASAALPAFAAAARVTLVEINPALRALQAEALAGRKIAWADGLEAVAPSPCLIVGNEFLDCLPIRQFVVREGRWRERLVGLAPGGGLMFGLARAPAPLDWPVGSEGAVREVAPGLPALVATIAGRLKTQAGRALFIDYGGVGGAGDTLQALAAHAKVDPLAAPGQADLTAHVDFAAVASAAHANGLAVHGPKGQGEWLEALGAGARFAVLARGRPDRADALAQDHHRLTHPDAMGNLFQAICLSTPGLPAPPGFAP